MKRILALALIIAIFLPIAVSAELSTSSLIEGKTDIGAKSIELVDGKVSVTDSASGVSASTITKIDGVEFKPATSKIVNGDVEWTTGEKSYLLLDDPVVKMSYNYSGNTLKETIVLKEDKILSFVLNLSKDSKLVPEIGGQWKVVSTISGNTMAGIILEKPFGIDAAGNRIEMEYTYEKGVLDLVYNRTITTYIYPQDEKEEVKLELSEIVYPLIIDPTWTSTFGYWTSTLNNNQTHLIKFNSTGSTTWTPRYFNNISILILAGGGSGGQEAGGGGGAGGFITSDIAVANGTSYNISVGSGGVYSYTNYTLNDGVNGTNSSFENATKIWVALGGGAGGGGVPNFTNGCGVAVNGKSGASGGGGAYGGIGGTNNASQGYVGGKGNSSDADCTEEKFSGAGGGGAGALGTNSSSSHPGDGGNGVQSNITGTLTWYAGGGGGGTPGVNHGEPGLGGGGHGGWSSTSALDGTNELGAGGGGARWDNTPPANPPGDGGSGVIIISYEHSAPWLNQANFTSAITSHPGLVVAFTDTSVKNVTENQTYLWEFGDGYTSSTIGNVTHIYSWTGIFTVNLTITSETNPTTLSRSEWITVDTDTSSASESSNNTRQVSYSPRVVTFQIVDTNNNPITGVPVDAVIDSYTFSLGATDLVNYYGLSLEAAQNALNQSFILHGVTDSTGQVAYTMLGGIKYSVNTTVAGTIYTTEVYPSDLFYLIRIPTSSYTSPENVVNSYTNIANATLTFSEPDTGNMTMGLDYLDISGNTDAITFTIELENNNTIMYTTSQAVTGAERILINQTYPNVRGQRWLWYYDAHRTV